MSLRLRLILVLLVVYSVGGYLIVRQALKEVEPRYLESMEESLVDIAVILASLVEQSADESGIHHESIASTMDQARDRRFDAAIYGFQKDEIGLQVYLTDSTGRVLYHSQRPETVGEDFSAWNDVHLTLLGHYGARASRENSDDPTSTVLHVAAPVRLGDRIVGVLTVGKPTSNVAALVASARRKVVWGAVLGGLVLLLGLLLVAGWVVSPIERLTRYARSVRDGEDLALPELPGKTLGDLGRSFDEMREALEGRQYVARYLQTITHAIKTPLTGIRGAAELLHESMSKEDREVFLANILDGTERIRDTVDRMLPLAALEARRGLEKRESFDLAGLIEELAQERRGDFESAGIELRIRMASRLVVNGDRLLLKEAIGNLVRNSFEFGSRGGEVEIRTFVTDKTVSIEVTDDGPGIPDFALDRVFDRFFSLPRPGSGDRSSGLGLSLVREIAHLHGGSVGLENRDDHGAVACLKIPLEQGA